MMHLTKHKKIILFDGMCNLCNSSVLKVIRFDTKSNFVFCALQSEIGQEIIWLIEKMEFGNIITKRVIKDSKKTIKMEC